MTYPTITKDAIRCGICPKEIMIHIPKSNISRWKKEKPEKYFGYELASGKIPFTIDQTETVLKGFVITPATFHALAKIVVTFSQIIREIKGFKSRMREKQLEIVMVLLNASRYIDLRILLSCCGISSSCFRNWKQQALFPCNNPSKKCARNHPLQIISSEFEMLKQVICNPKTIHWSIRSLCLHAKRLNILHLRESTYYKYNNIHQWREKLFPKVKKPKYSSLKASAPDEIWHCDTTRIRLKNGLIRYIYFITDNFSRKIIAWLIAPTRNAFYTKEVLQRAFSNSFSKENLKNIDFIVDNGSEFNNEEVTSFLSDTILTMKIAQKEIIFSNSMVEATHKEYKYGFFYRNPPTTDPELYDQVDYYVNERNGIKPRKSLNGLTPDEAHARISHDTFQFDHNAGLARQNRIRINKTG